jgi:hypothetical protein
MLPEIFIILSNLLGRFEAIHGKTSQTSSQEGN